MKMFKRGSVLMQCFWLFFVILESAGFGFHFAQRSSLSAVCVFLTAYGVFFLWWNSRPIESNAKSEPKQIKPEPESLSARFASGYKPQGFREEA